MKTNLLLSLGFLSLVGTTDIFAQLPADLPWSGSDVGGQTVILQPGIAAVTCGTISNTTFVPVAERWTFGLMNVDDVIPASGRSNVSAAVEMYHHPSWHIDQIGNVFGLAINTRTGDIFTTASTNYGAGFYGESAILRFGSIGGGADSLAAAGTVYKIDAVTGQASVFAVLPQQLTTVVHVNGSLASETMTRNTGVGLGNICYDELRDQYFVTNIEDGRIYRLDSTGAILDSFDPLGYDDGVAGISDLEGLVYGLAVEPGGHRLLFGGIDTGSYPRSNGRRSTRST